MSPGGLDWKLSFPFSSPLGPCVKILILLVKKHTVSHAGKGTLPSGQWWGRGEGVGWLFLIPFPCLKGKKKFLPFEGSVITFSELRFYWIFIPSRAGSPPLALCSFGWKVYKTL